MNELLELFGRDDVFAFMLFYGSALGKGVQAILETVKSRFPESLKGWYALALAAGLSIVLSVAYALLFAEGMGTDKLAGMALVTFAASQGWYQRSATLKAPAEAAMYPPYGGE